MDKRAGSLAEAVADIPDGAMVMIGGFGGSGAPIELIHALINRFLATESPKGLTIVNNNAGNGRVGIAAMIDHGMVRKTICSFPRSTDPRAFAEKYLAGELELVPQGTLAERIRAGGAGISAFCTPTSFGTDLAKGKPVAEFEGRSYVQERWLKADYALIKAETGDSYGNLTYRMAARNFSSLMAAAADLYDRPGDEARGAWRHRSRSRHHAGHFRRRLRRSPGSPTGGRTHPRGGASPMSQKLSNAQIAWRAAQDIADGAYVNLGIGFPEMVAKFQPPGRIAFFHTENGVLGFGEAPPPGEEDWDLINAGKKPITLKPGASFFHHADSFAMVRGGHLDVAILGAFQVAESGDLANWSTGPKGVPAIGGAMDVVHGAKRVAVITEHVTKDGEPKLLDRCTMPLTGVACVTRVYTSLAVVDVEDGRFVLREKLPEISLEKLQSVTRARLHLDGGVADLIVPEL
jgi:3-oxoadipate CoA-transferase, beta subunit